VFRGSGGKGMGEQIGVAAFSRTSDQNGDFHISISPSGGLGRKRACPVTPYTDFG